MPNVDDIRNGSGGKDFREKLMNNGEEICFPSGMEKMGEITKKLYDTLTGVPQIGRIEAPKGWIHVLMNKKIVFQI